MLIPRFVVRIVSVGILVLGAGGVSGQDYPNKPIRIVTGGVGGGNDFTARLIAPGISGALGQPVIVENRGGGVASGEAVSKAAPDGYALLVTGTTLWIGPLLQKTPYDPVRDFSAIATLGIEPNILLVHPSMPAKSVKELIALAKARPGELNYSFGSTGGSGHIAAELFKMMADVKIQGVPYKSDAQEISDLIAGYVQVNFQGGAKAGPLVQTGKLRALAVGTAEPTALFPGLPTIAASGGLPGFESTSRSALFAPAKTPPAIIARLNQELVRLLSTTDVKERFFKAGVETAGGPPEELAAMVKSEMARVSRVIKEAGIRAE